MFNRKYIYLNFLIWVQLLVSANETTHSVVNIVEAEKVFVQKAFLSQQSKSTKLMQIKNTGNIVMLSEEKMEPFSKYAVFTSSDLGKSFIKYDPTSSNNERVISEIHMSEESFELFDYNERKYYFGDSYDAKFEFIHLPMEFQRVFWNRFDRQKMMIVVDSLEGYHLNLTEDGGNNFTSISGLVDLQKLSYFRWLNETTFLAYINRSDTYDIWHINSDEIKILQKTCSDFISQGIHTFIICEKENTGEVHTLFSSNGSVFLPCKFPYQNMKIEFKSIKVVGNHVYVVVTSPKDTSDVLYARYNDQLPELTFILVADTIFLRSFDEFPVTVRNNMDGFMLLTKMFTTRSLFTTAVTFNYGRTWNMIQIRDSENIFEFNKCQKSQTDPLKSVYRVCENNIEDCQCRKITDEAPESAPWLVFRNVCLLDIRKVSRNRLLISRNFGYSFEIINKSYAYNFVLNYGGIIFFATEDMKTIEFTIDEGRNFYPIPGEYSNQLNLQTMVSYEDLALLIVALDVGSGKLTTIYIDFSKLIEGKCTPEDLTTVRFSPDEKICYMGREAKMQIKIAGSKCRIDEKPTIREVACPCDPKDFPCETGFIHVSGECVHQDSNQSFEAKTHLRRCKIGETMNTSLHRDSELIQKSCFREIDGKNESISQFFSPEICFSDDETESILILTSKEIKIMDVKMSKTSSSELKSIFKVNTEKLQDIAINYHSQIIYGLIDFQLHQYKYDPYIVNDQVIDWTDSKFPESLNAIEIDSVESLLYFLDSKFNFGVFNLASFKFAIFPSLGKMRKMKVYPESSLIIFITFYKDLKVCRIRDMSCTLIPVSNTVIDFSWDPSIETLFVLGENSICEKFTRNSTNENRFIRQITYMGMSSITFEMIVVAQNHIIRASSHILKFDWSQRNEYLHFPANEPLIRLKKVFRYSWKSHLCIELEGCNKPCIISSIDSICYPNRTSDEEKCHYGQFKCNSDQCIDRKKLCDGFRDCKDGEDEMDCTECTKGKKLCENEGCIPEDMECMQKECKGDQCAENSCGNEMFQCRDKSCISSNLVCDNKNDCSTGEDEKNCIKTCGYNEFKCSNQKCIPNEKLCNGEHDCTDGSDEKYCSRGRCDFKCNDNYCLTQDDVCNEIWDCLQGEDEENCKGYCKDDAMFYCQSGECISKFLVCDGKNDCNDGSDEHCKNEVDHVCGEGYFKCDDDGLCISSSSRCDNITHCFNGVDEFNCTVVLVNECLPPNHRCLNNTCISPSQICDGVNDCGNMEDEMMNCEKETCVYRCQENICITSEQICNRIKECDDGRDEHQCHGALTANISISLASLCFIGMFFGAWYCGLFRNLCYSGRMTRNLTQGHDSTVELSNHFNEYIDDVTLSGVFD